MLSKFILKIISRYRNDDALKESIREEILIDLLDILDMEFEYSRSQYEVRDEYHAVEEWTGLDDNILAKHISAEFEICVTYDELIKCHTLHDIIDLIIDKRKE